MVSRDARAVPNREFRLLQSLSGSSRIPPVEDNPALKDMPLAASLALARIRTLWNPARALRAIRGNRCFVGEMFGVAWGQIAAAAGGICGVRILTGLLSPADPGSDLRTGGFLVRCALLRWRDGERFHRMPPGA